MEPYGVKDLKILFVKYLVTYSGQMRHMYIVYIAPTKMSLVN